MNQKQKFDSAARLGAAPASLCDRIIRIGVYRKRGSEANADRTDRPASAGGR
jgi:hypothetical protein